MNNLTSLSPERRSLVLQERFARRVAAALSQLQTAQPRHDIDERLRVAREQALARRPRTREVREAAGAGAVVATGGGTATLGSTDGSATPWWLRLSALLPLGLLLAGLMLIDRHYTQSQIEAAAEIDAQILADDLPPEAYRDPGFLEFLKRERP
jgi:protein-S-isoprenylcysteine O-methyltransferase Ste14